ncbi:unnamed protein product [Owenia fusiformis]|uniref:Uncharacterized protein n=1 Tax=Owenia fusiformis TaxID=6347 RepID=A0A8S4Q982_OWEFU|nr:unnamed protein product [Owenia fusiformis]
MTEHTSDIEPMADKVISALRNDVNSNVLFLGKHISHTWTESNGTDTVYSGKVTRLLSGTDGTETASYALIYDNQDDISDSDSEEVILSYSELMEDFKSNTLTIL